MELERDKLIFNGGYEEEIIQIILNEDIIVPDTKDDISNIVQVDSEVHIKKHSISNNTLEYEGILEYDVLYIAEGGDKNIYNIVSEIEFSDIANTDKNSLSNYSIAAEVEHLQYKIINSRKINIKAVINVKLKSRKNIVADMTNMKKTSEVEQLTKQIELDTISDSKAESITIKESITLPSTKPSIRNILKCNLSLKNSDVRLFDEKINVKGNLYLNMLYNNYENAVEILEYDIPINEMIDNVNCNESMMDISNFEIIDKYIEVSPDDDGEERILNMEATILAKIDIVGTQKKDILSDAYSTSKNINLKKENIHHEKLFSKNKTRNSIKEIIKLDANESILQIYSVTGNIKVNEVKAKDNAIEVNGIIESKVLYIVADDEQPIKAQVSPIFFSEELDVAGVNENMKVDVAPNIEHIAFNMMAKNEIEVKISISLDAIISEDRVVEVVTDVEEYGPINYDDYPSMIIYMAKPEDNLWSIAKKYNTTIDSLVSINDIENNNAVKDGQKMIILKNMNIA